ncbi:MAG: hypothetical protein D3924_20290, partial [Candidatus Electrothrix sp. AR4]|nr:hypothetical protein [Candidatus Electrothrix sp. AR4]
MISPKSLAVCVLTAVLLLFSLSAQAHIDEAKENSVRIIPSADMPPLRKILFWMLENRPST